MTEQAVRQALEDDKTVFYHVWCYSKWYMSCSGDCCNDSLSGVEEAMSIIASHCSGRWDEVTIED